MTKVKICGITNIEDALLAARAGADMLGFNFYAKSPRYISPEAALKIIRAVPETVAAVGVFVNAEQPLIVDRVEMLGLDAVQLHGDEDDDFIQTLEQTVSADVIRVVRISPDFRAESLAEYKCDSVLLDTFSAAAYGGTGEKFDWNKAKGANLYVQKLFLAGGLTPENVADAVAAVRPYAVDTASGVEASPGKKDPAKLEAFIFNAKNA